MPNVATKKFNKLRVVEEQDILVLLGKNSLMDSLFLGSCLVEMSHFMESKL